MADKYIVLLFSILTAFLLLWISSSDAAASDSSIQLSNNGTVEVHENQDSASDVNNVTSFCLATYDCSNDCSNPGCGGDGCISNVGQCTKICERSGECDTCTVSCATCGSLFEMIGTTVIRKKECLNPGCDQCDLSDNCVNAGEEYSLTVTCRHTGGSLITDGEVSATFKVLITANDPPSISFSEGTNITINKNDYSEGDTINRITYTDSDQNIGDDTIRYSVSNGSSPSYNNGNILFGIINNTTANIVVKSDLSMEFSYYYDMVLCVHDRRDSACATLNITLVGCYQTPNCSDVNLNIADTFGTSHNSPAGLLYNMTSPDPDQHFPDFRSTWEELSWNFVTNDLGTETSLNQSTGEIHVVQNISIHPAYPSKTFTQVISVANTESCHITSCTLTITVNYTNWPIEIRSLPTSYNESEDNDAEDCMLTLDIYDYNYESEDNVTCEITSISPNETNLFELKDDSNYARTSYTLCKLRCQQPGCGYKAENYTCPTDIGCLNHNLTQQYNVTIRCEDAYGSVDEGVFTMDVVKNEAPQYTNLPNNVILDTESVAHLDTIFTIIYRDNENEPLNYSYVFADVDNSSVDPGYFSGTPTGNFSNGLGNITMTVYLHDKDVNKTYTAVICGHERRNEICATLTIKLEEYCGETPNCSHSDITINATDTINELFDIQQLVYQTTNKDLSFAIAHPYGDLFAVNDSTGIITKTGLLPATYPYTQYTLSAFVYEADACFYGHCSLTVKVNHVNEPIFVTISPNNVTIHEDDVTTVTVANILTSDDSTDDSVSCLIANVDSVEPFYITETLAGSEEFLVMKRENAVLSSATTTYAINITCSDDYGSNDTGTLTVTVELNQGPVIQNLGSPTSLNADLLSSTAGSTVFTVTANDTENDELTFNCSVQNSMVPLNCRSVGSEASIYLTRSIRIDYEDGSTYGIDICVGDEKHEANSCGSLSVTFTSNKTAAEISNLPDSVSFSENTPVGTTLFSLNVADPDIGEDHTFGMAVTPKSENSVFQITSEGNLVLAGELDYERHTSYQFWVTVTDEHLGEQASKTLTLTVDDVNEPNTLTVATATITFREDTEANSVLEDPGFTFTDEDNGETFTYSIQAEYDYFSIDSNTGALTLTKEWDLESASNLPTTTTITVTCTDSGGLNSSAVITVNIEEVNEYAPELTVLFGDPSQPIQVNSTTKPTETFLTVQASDQDYNDDGDFVGSIVGTGLGFRTMRMVPEGSGTTIFHLKPLVYFYYTNSKDFQFTISVCDGEATRRCQKITLSVVYTADIPVTNTKAETKCILCTNNGKAVVAILIVEGILIFCFILHCYCSMSCSKKDKTEEKLNSIKLRMMAPVKNNVANKTLKGRRAGAVSTKRAKPPAVSSTSLDVDEDDSSSSSYQDSDDEQKESQKRMNNFHTKFAEVRLFKASKVDTVFDVNGVKSRMASGKSRVSETSRSRASSGKSRVSVANVALTGDGLPNPVYSSNVLASF